MSRRYGLKPADLDDMTRAEMRVYLADIDACRRLEKDLHDLAKDGRVTVVHDPAK